MSTLWVIRHGQASFFDDNYDKLSDKGQLQSQRLGEHWAAAGQDFDEVFIGPRQRHRHTAELIAAPLQAAGLSWPAPTVLPGLDEYQAEEVLKLALPKLVEEHPGVRRLHEEFAAAVGRENQLRMFQRMYEVVIRRWAGGELELPEVESWQAFEARTHEALAHVLAGQTGQAGQGNRRVALVTSGGPVGVAVQRALSVGLDATLQLAWMVRNAAFCQFLFSGSRFTLSSYNAFPHLTDPGLLTYR